MITELMKMFEAFRAGVDAARAVMDDRQPVLVEDVLSAEGCECPAPRVVVVHTAGSVCDDRVERFLRAGGSLDNWPAVDEALDLLAHEADRRDGVRRGPR